MRFFSLIFLAAMSFSTFAQVDSTINFSGQNSEVIKVEKNVNVVRPVAYQVPDTCYNSVPYQSYECHDETRYRNECHYVPSSESCHTENDRVCRNVTRTREECSTGSGREVCTERPSREVCVERPTREVCRIDSSGENRCVTVGGGQSCQTVGGGQSCTTVPGERTCRDVSYTDQDCDNVPRQVCTHSPARNVCRDIPYSENVCGNETRYRQVPYACERTAYRDVTTPKKLTGQIEVRFETNGLVEEFPLQILAAAPDAKFEAFTIEAKLKKEPKVLVFLKKKMIKAKESTKEINLQGEVVFEVVTAEMITPVFPTKFANAALDTETDILSLEFEGAISALGSVEAKVVANPKIGKDRLVAELKAEYPSERAKVAGNKMSLNLKDLIQNDLKKRNQVSLKLTSKMSVRGELMNTVKPVMEKAYSLPLYP